MVNKALLGIAAVIAGGYAACRGIAEMQERREISAEKVNVEKIEGIFSWDIMQYRWEKGKPAVVSYTECSHSAYGRFAVVVMPRCREVSFVTPGICSDALEGICVDDKCRERGDLSPEQIRAGFRKYEELCDILDCEGICEEWEKL